MSKYAYHITPRTNLVSIRQEGLRPSFHTLREGEKAHSGVMMYETAEAAKKAVAHTTNPRWCADAMVLLAVDVEGYVTLPRLHAQLLVCTDTAIDQAGVHVTQVLVRSHNKKEDTVGLPHIQV